MQTSLRRIASRAAKEREHRFCNLYGLLNEANLKECFQELKKKAAPGVDGVDWHEYEADLETNIRDLVERLKRKRYRARLVRRKYIEKANGKKRPLGIPVIEDKLLQLAVAKILGAIYEQDFLKSSYGYRPGVGVHDALSTLTRALQYGKYQWVVEADIRGFFDNIDHDLLLRMLERRVNDGALLRLIRKWLKAGILEEDGRVLRPETGTPQGGVVSPVLANIYLHYALDLWFARAVWPGCGGEVRIIRYADDFVCAFERKEEAEGFYQRLGGRLKEYGLTLSEEKTRVVKFDASEKADSGTFEFLGIEFRRGTNRQGGAQVHRRTSRQKLRASIASFTAWIKTVRHRGIGAIMQTLRSKYRGYWNHYGIRGNFASLQLFYEETQRILKKWLNRRSQRRSYCWEAMQDLLKQFRIPLPHITENTRARQMSFL